MIDQNKLLLGLGDYLGESIGQQEFDKTLSGSCKRNQAEIDKIAFAAGLKCGSDGALVDGMLDEEFLVMKVKDFEGLKADRERYDVARKEFFKERNQLLEMLRDVCPEQAKAFE